MTQEPISKMPGAGIGCLLGGASRAGIVGLCLLLATGVAKFPWDVFGAALVVGSFIGLFAGYAPNVRTGVVIGGVLSFGVSIYTLPFVGCMVSTSIQGASGDSFFYAIFLVSLAGAASGGVGGWVNQRAAERLRQQRIVALKERYRSQPTEFLTTTLGLGTAGNEANAAIQELLNERRTATPPGGQSGP